MDFGLRVTAHEVNSGWKILYGPYRILYSHIIWLYHPMFVPNTRAHMHAQPWKVATKGIFFERILLMLPTSVREHDQTWITWTWVISIGSLLYPKLPSFQGLWPQQSLGSASVHPFNTFSRACDCSVSAEVYFYAHASWAAWAKVWKYFHAVSNNELNSMIRFCDHVDRPCGTMRFVYIVPTWKNHLLFSLFHRGEPDQCF